MDRIHQKRPHGLQVTSQLLLPGQTVRISHSTVARRATHNTLHRRHRQNTILRRVNSTFQQVHQIGQRMATTHLRGHRRTRRRLEPTPRTGHRTIIKLRTILRRIVHRLVHTLIRLLVVRPLQALGRHRHVQTRLHLHLRRPIRNLHTQMINIDIIRNTRSLFAFIHQRGQRTVGHNTQHLFRYVSRLLRNTVRVITSPLHTSLNINLRRRTGTLTRIISTRRRQVVTTLLQLRGFSAFPTRQAISDIIHIALTHHAITVIRRTIRRQRQHQRTTTALH